MDKGRRLECAPWRLSPHVALRHSAQFPIHQRHHAFQRCLVAVAPGMDESGNVGWSLWCHVRPEFLQSLYFFGAISVYQNGGEQNDEVESMVAGGCNSGGPGAACHRTENLGR